MDAYPASPKARQQTPFAGHPAHLHLRRLQQALLDAKAVRRHPHLLVTGSIGKGRWASVPWAALLDRRLTTSAQSGLYVSYLFAADMSAVHLCLGFGTSGKPSPALAAEGPALPYDVANWQARPGVQALRAFGFTFQQPQLHADRGLGVDYPRAVIAHKAYPREQLPPDPALEQDLGNVLHLYDEAVKSLAPAQSSPAVPPPPAQEPPRLYRVSLSGYRSFEGFDSGELGALSVLIGPNGAGKSNFLDFLRFLRFAATHHPLPPALDPQAEGRELFFAGSPPRLSWELHFAWGENREVVHVARFTGSQGGFSLQRELLEERWPNGSFSYLEVANGMIIVARAGLPEPDNEQILGRQHISFGHQLQGLWLARLRGPGQDAPGIVAETMAGWGFFGNLDVGPHGPARRPCLVQPQPQLAEDGSNLAAVLFHMQNQAHLTPESAWDELQLQLGLLVPGFRQLRAEVTAPGHVGTFWEEEGWSKPLSLAEVSDGTLRLVYWLTLCFAPQVPPLVLADEPDAGLHPRVLPTLAQLLQRLAERTQVIIITHSPYFLAHFPLSAILVAGKEKGRTLFRRPGNSKALQQLLKETGDAGLADLFIAEGLELFP
jgi:predicted ATPase